MGCLLPSEQRTNEHHEEQVEEQHEHEADQDQEDAPVSPAKVAQGAPLALVRTGGAGVSVTHHAQSSAECFSELS